MAVVVDLTTTATVTVTIELDDEGHGQVIRAVVADDEPKDYEGESIDATYGIDEAHWYARAIEVAESETWPELEVGG